MVLRVTLVSACLVVAVLLLRTCDGGAPPDSLGAAETTTRNATRGVATELARPSRPPAQGDSSERMPVGEGSLVTPASKPAEAPMALVVTVRDAERAPLPQVLVRVERGGDVFDLFSGDDGTARFDLPKSGVWKAAAPLAGTATSVEVGPGVHSVELVLEGPSRLLEGRVVDSEGRGVPGARIWMGDRGWASRGRTFVAETDRDGAFSLSCVGGEMAFVGCVAEGFLPSSPWMFGGDVGNRITLTLERSVASLLVTTDLDADGTVAVRPTGHDRGRLWTWPFVAKLTDGRASIPHVLPASVSIGVFVPGYLTEERDVALHPDADNAVHVSLRPGCELSGAVQAEDGTPLALVLVREAELFGRGVLSAADGTFELAGLPPESKVSFSKDRYCHQTLAVQACSSTPLVATLERSVTLRGAVRDPNGSGLAGWTVYCRDARAMAMSDDGGRFELIGCLKPGHSVEVTKVGEPDRATFVVSPADLSGDERVVTVSARAHTARISGRITGPKGLATGAALLVIEQDPAGAAFSRSARADADGVFALDLPPGSYAVSLMGDFLLNQRVDVDLADGEALDLGTHFLEAGGRIRIRGAHCQEGLSVRIPAERKLLGTIAGGELSTGVLREGTYELLVGTERFDVAVRAGLETFLDPCKGR